MPHGTCECTKCSYRRAIAAGSTPVFVIVRSGDESEAAKLELWQSITGTSKAIRTWPFRDVDEARDAIPARLKRVDKDRSRPPHVAEVWA